MKESAIIALQHLKSHSDWLGLTPDVFDKWNVHIHVLQGAIPKDGPSAGVTMLTALASAFTQRKVRKFLAMSEITLRGQVLPVGGIKEKILPPSVPASRKSSCVSATGKMWTTSIRATSKA